MSSRATKRRLTKAMRDRIWAAAYAAAFVDAAREAARLLNTSPCAAAERHDFAEAAEGMAERAVQQYERWLREGKT